MSQGSTAPLSGPQSGPQPQVKYCPCCKGDVHPIASRKQPAATSHTYNCSKCGKTFEINDLS